MSQLPAYTTVIQDARPVASVHFEPSAPVGYPWYPVHAWMHRSGLYPILPHGARAIIDVLLWQLWEQAQQPGYTPGMVIATIDQFAAWCGASTRSAFRDVGFLLEPPPSVLAITGEPARLLAKRGPTVWEPLPGRSLAGRRGKTDTPVPSLATDCQRNSAPDGPPLRALHTNQPKPETERLVRPERADPDSSKRGLVGWPELSLFGQRAMASGDVRALLIDLRVWEYLASPIAAAPGITCDRVIREAAEVSADRGAFNKPLCLGKRLALAFGVRIDQPPTKSRGVVPAGFEGIARRRAERGIR